jgi:Photosystem I psaA/psaB protein
MVTRMVDVVSENRISLFLIIGPGDFLIQQAIVLVLHTTILILVKYVFSGRCIHRQVLTNVT